MIFNGINFDHSCRTLANYFITHVMGIVVITSTSVVVGILNGNPTQNISQFPLDTLVYYRSLVAPNLAILSLTVSFLSKKNYVKVFVDEVKYLYFGNFHSGKVGC